MQIISSLAVFASLIVNMGQEAVLPLVVKTYVALGFLLTIDNLFCKTLAPEIAENAKKLNDSGILKMGPDNNTYEKIWANRKRTGFPIWRSFANVFI